MSSIPTSFTPTTPDPSGWLYLRAARRTQRPIVVTLHNVMTHQLQGSLDLLETLLLRADWVTGVSQDVVNDTLRFAPAVAAKASVIRNGIAPPIATVTPVPFDPPRLTCIGRLVPQKGFDRGINAFASLAPRFPDLRLTIAG